MRTYGVNNGYSNGPGENPAVHVQILVTTDDDVDPHDAMSNLVDSTRDLLEHLHAHTDCPAAAPEDRAAALAALFLKDDDDE